MDTQTLRDAMTAAFVTTGSATPSWPDPHAWSGEPLEEEYSRLLDPGKYRILRARWDAWVQALTGFGLGVVEEVGDPVGAWGEALSDLPERTVRLRPVRAGALPLLLGSDSLDGVPDATAGLGAGEPAVLALSLPGCGCDACDDGSDQLLDELDEHVLAVVTGEFVHLEKKRGGGTVVSTAPGEWSAEGDFAEARDVDALLGQARAGRSGPSRRVVRGAAWW